MRIEAFTEIFSTKFSSFVSRMYLDYCDENNDLLSITDDYPTYLINNFQVSSEEDLTQRTANEEWNVK